MLCELDTTLGSVALPPPPPPLPPLQMYIYFRARTTTITRRRRNGQDRSKASSSVCCLNIHSYIYVFGEKLWPKMKKKKRQEEPTEPTTVIACSNLTTGFFVKYMDTTKVTYLHTYIYTLPTRTWGGGISSARSDYIYLPCEEKTKHDATPKPLSKSWRKKKIKMPIYLIIIIL